MPRRSRTSSTTPARRSCSSTPSSRTSLQGVEAKHKFVIGTEADAELYARRRRSRTVDRPGREHHRDDQLHERHHRPPEGRAAHPPQHLAERGDVRLAHDGQRPRRAAAHAPDVPLQRLGHAVRGHRHGRPPHRAAQGRRRRDPAARRDHGVTLMCGAPAVVAAILDAAQEWDGPIPGRGTTRIVVAGAPPPTRTIERVQTELGWEFMQIYGLTETTPLLTINRTRAEYDELDPNEHASRLGRAGVARTRRAHPCRRRRRGTRPRQPRDGRVLGAAGCDREGDRRRLVPHRRRRLRRRRRTTCRSRIARRT